MLANVYLNWAGTPEEFVRVKTIVKDLIEKTEGVNLEGLYEPNNRWNYAVVYKFNSFDKFVNFQKEVRILLAQQNLAKIPDRELILMIEDNKLNK